LLWAIGLAMLGAGLYLIVHKHNSSNNTSTIPPSTVKNKPPPSRPVLPTINIYQVQGKGGKLGVFAHPLRTGAADPTTALAQLRVSGTLTITNGTATLPPLEHSDARHAAEVVWTLTQFAQIKRVSIGGGKPLTRADEVAFAPPILIESPIGPNPVANTFHVTGSAVVFEGTLVAELQLPTGKMIRKSVTATSGAPDLGTFDVTFTVPKGTSSATLSLFAPSAQNGKPQHEVSERVPFATG
jgi:hypothetical protein